MCESLFTSEMFNGCQGTAPGCYGDFLETFSKQQATKSHLEKLLKRVF